MTAASDPGLQPERTALAWRRTALALMVGPVVAARLLVPELGAVAVVAAAGGLVLGVSVAISSTGRHRRVLGRTASTADPGDRTGAALLLVTALIPLCAGLLVLALVLGRI
ncbi:MAG: DUF202 domain-containing protein [Cellulomonas sp.]